MPGGNSEEGIIRHQPESVLLIQEWCSVWDLQESPKNSSSTYKKAGIGSFAIREVKS